MSPDSKRGGSWPDEEFEAALERLVREADTSDIARETWFTFRHPDPDTTDWEVRLTRLEDPQGRN